MLSQPDASSGSFSKRPPKLPWSNVGFPSTLSRGGRSRRNGRIAFRVWLGLNDCGHASILRLRCGALTGCFGFVGPRRLSQGQRGHPTMWFAYAKAGDIGTVAHIAKWRTSRLGKRWPPLDVHLETMDLRSGKRVSCWLLSLKRQSECKLGVQAKGQLEYCPSSV